MMRALSDRTHSLSGPVALFSTGLFLSSILLFVIEPIMAKRVLPFLGGGPQVWNTCVLFYQLALLGGYGYAHLISEHLSSRAQAVLHAALCLAAAAALFLIPISPPTEPPASPILWLLGHLTLAIGLPFFVLSANGPLLQRWFSRMTTGVDPYLLFTASNFGSFLALLSYPFLIEPRIALSRQMELWRLAFLLFFAALAACAAAVSFRPGAPRPLRTRSAEPMPRVRWIFLAFVPSSLMLGVTTFLTTDLAPVPLLWTAPLALYLASFILVFTPFGLRWSRPCKAALPFLALALFSLVTVGPMWPLLALHLGGFFIAAMACHGELSEIRPSVERMTDYYLCMVLGGALSGIFNALCAPVLFLGVLEYPLALLLSCAVAVGTTSKAENRDWPRAAAGSAAVFIAAAYLCYRSTHPGILIGRALAVTGFLILAGVMTGLHRQRRLLGLVFAVVLIMRAAGAGQRERTLFTGRSFYGVYRITEDLKATTHYFYHGRVSHGLQFSDPRLKSRPVGSYYDPAGPLGRVFELLGRMPASKPIAVVGLGPGEMIAYARPKERWDFYEIDPMVARIARDPALFTFLSDSRADWRIILGDARLTIAGAPAHGYKMIVLDAFGSDAVPIHILTHEAVKLYLSKLDPDGLLVFHATNAYLDLLQPIGDVGRSHGLAVVTAQDPGGVTESILRPRSRWVVMSPNSKILGALASPSAETTPKGRVWTDDYSNLFGAVRWR